MDRKLSIGTAGRIEVLKRIFGPRLHLESPDTGDWREYRVELFTGRGECKIHNVEIVSAGTFLHLLNRIGTDYLRAVHNIDPLTAEELPPQICPDCGRSYRYWGQSK